MEMSPFPQKALRAGDRLRDLVPDCGHLVHMPTHIDVLCGHYHDVVDCNQTAIVADRKFLAREGAMNFYTVYRTHNYHFEVYGAMFLGQYEPALEAAQELIDTMPEALLRIPSPPMADFLEGYLSMKQHVLIRFGKWHEIIAQELPGDRELYCSTTAMMLYAKGVAHSALGDIAEAEAAKAAFLEAKRARAGESAGAQQHRPGPAGVAEEMLNGELEYRRGNHDVAFAHLRRSVELDDALPYDEPWGWMQPTRHALGALLLEQDRVAEAEAIYRSDLGLDGKLSRRLPASGQPLEPARPARMPDPSRRDGRGAHDQAAPRPGAGTIGGAGEGLLLLPHEGRGLSAGALKFGLYSSIANPPHGEQLDRCIDEVIAEAQLAEASGFDSCFFGEHHQDQDGFLPSPLIVATAVAARTTRLRVGTSVILLPLHHPVHVAEDVVTLDLVSKGRVILGVGIGYQPADFRAFSVSMEDRAGRFEESIEILRRCWAGEPFSFRGKHYSLEDVQVRPRPYQKPGPPLWIGASIAAAARRAGRIADGFVGTPSTGLANATHLADVYKEAAREARRPAEVVQMRDAWVARSRAEADAVYGPHVMTAYRYYWENRLAEFRNLSAGSEFTLDTLAPDRLILGDPDTCIREFQRWQKATDASTFLLRLRHAHSGGPPHDKIMDAIRLFGERVLPYV